MSDIALGGVLGEGTFGVVFAASCRGRAVALKRLKLLHFGATYVSPQMLRHKLEAEATLMCRLDHPHIIRFIGLLAEEGHRPPAIVTELAVGSLHELLLGPDRDGVGLELGLVRVQPDLDRQRAAHTQPAVQPTLSWSRRVLLAQQLASGVAYLHAQEPPIIHRDLKPANCLIDRCGTLKLSDFGLSRLIESATDLHSAADYAARSPSTPSYACTCEGMSACAASMSRSDVSGSTT